jgi:hypothetical protein
MRYRLRTLLIFLALGPPIGAWLYCVASKQTVRARRNALRESTQILAGQYGIGAIPFVELSRAYVELDEAEIAAADTPAERKAAYDRRVEHMKELEAAQRR